MVLTSSYSLPLPLTFPSTDSENMFIYVKVHATICGNIRIYVCTSDSPYTNTLTFKSNKT